MYDCFTSGDLFHSNILFADAFVLMNGNASDPKTAKMLFFILFTRFPREDRKF